MRRSHRALVVTTLAVALLPRAAAAQSPTTTLLRGGTVVDGTGAPARVADILIRDAHIERIAPTINAPAGTRIVNAKGLIVAPGFIDTPLLRNRHDSASVANLEAMHPLGRLGKAEEITSMVALLLSDESSFITGAVMNIDGGYTIR
jgi:N-acetylglucosamine-6-phosphate deacetylase